MKKKKVKAKSKPKTSKKVKARKPVRAKAKGQAKAKAKKSSSKTKASASTPKPGVIAPAGGVLLGYVEDYFAKIGVVALTLQAPVALGHKIQIIGHTTNFEQTIDSMQIEHAVVTQAGPRDGVGIKVKDRARAGDHVYRLT